MATAVKDLDKAAIMAELETVPDPEIPVLTITDLGIVRGIAENPPRVRISPTYTGCPATVAIEMLIRQAQRPYSQSAYPRRRRGRRPAADHGDRPGAGER